jgi:hypothetical protein
MRNGSPYGAQLSRVRAAVPGSHILIARSQHPHDAKMAEMS